MFYWFLKWIALGPVLRLIFRPRVEGAEHVPETGPAILASNHLSYADWLFMPLTLPRRVTFVAKAEYFTTPGLKGWFQTQVLLRRRPGADRPRGRDAAEGALSSARTRPGGGGAVRHLPRGHPLARRPALPRQDRRRAAGPRDRRAGDPGRRGRHRRGRAAGQEVRHRHPAVGALRRARWTSPATRAWRTTATSCARSPTRSCTRSCGSPGRSTSTCTRPGQGAGGEGQGGGEAGRARRPREGGPRGRPGGRRRCGQQRGR